MSVCIHYEYSLLELFVPSYKILYKFCSSKEKTILFVLSLLRLFIFYRLFYKRYSSFDIPFHSQSRQWHEQHGFTKSSFAECKSWQTRNNTRDQSVTRFVCKIPRSDVGRICLSVYGFQVAVHYRRDRDAADRDL